MAAGTGRGVLEEGGTTAASAGGQVGDGQDSISVSQPSLLKSLRTISVAAETNLSPGLLLLHDAKYLSPLCFLSFSCTHMHALCGSNELCNQREVISGKEMFSGCVIREV